jgi:hypothetical protein
MKVAVVVLACALVMMFAALAPVFAKPAEKVAFSGIQIPNSPENQPPPGPYYRTWLTLGDTMHTRNGLGAGTIMLTVDGQDPMPGTTSSTIDINARIYAGGVIKFDMTWTFENGEFVGNIIGKVTSPVSFEDMHGVLQGSGDYEGWTVLLNGYVNAGPFMWSGTIVIPK